MSRDDYLTYDGPKDGHPVWREDIIWVDVQIKHVASGVVRTARQWMIYGDGDEPSTFMYEDGNYSCDCNRGLFFARAADEEEPDVECGESVYRVNLANPKNGAVFYREFE